MISQDHRVTTIHKINIDIQIVIPTQGGKHIFGSHVKPFTSQESTY